MTQSVLQSIQDKWNKSSVVQSAAPLPASAVPIDSNANPFPCEWIGRVLGGNVCHDPEQGVARLLELLQEYPFKPYFNEEFGCGFEYPYEPDRCPPLEIVAEFSTLWFSAAGDKAIEQIGHTMPTYAMRRPGERRGYPRPLATHQRGRVL